MQAGRLGSLVTIQKRTSPADSWGAPLPEGWEEHCSVWANVKHLSGAESIKADADVSTVRASVRIRFRTDVNAGMRVLIGGAVYLIDAVLTDMAQRKHVDLVCKRVT